MSDLINRQGTIDRINEYIEEYSEIDSDGNHSEKWCAMQEAKMTIENMPSAQPERLKGHWIPLDEYFDEYECDVCRTTYDTVCGTFDLPYFCTHCGADMRGGEDETD